MAGKRGNGEGSIYKRWDGRWTAAVTIPDGTRKEVTGKTRVAVDARLTGIKQSIRDNLPVPNEKLTTERFLTDWLEGKKARGLRSGTHKNYASYVRLHLSPGLGRYALVKLTPGVVQAFLDKKLAEGMSPNAVRYCRTVLRAALSDAMKQEKVIRNVAKLVQLPKVEGKTRRGRPFAPEQADQLMEGLANHRLFPLWLLELTTTAGPGEALALRWKETGLGPEDGIIDLDAGKAYVRYSLHRVAGEWLLEPLKTDKRRRDLVLPKVVLTCHGSA